MEVARIVYTIYLKAYSRGTGWYLDWSQDWFSSFVLVFSTVYMSGNSYTRLCCTILLELIQGITSPSISITYIFIMGMILQWWKSLSPFCPNFWFSWFLSSALHKICHFAYLCRPWPLWHSIRFVKLHLIKVQLVDFRESDFLFQAESYLQWRLGVMAPFACFLIL